VPPTLVDTDETALKELRAAGLRVTAPRRAVLAWLVENPHSTVDAAEVVFWGRCPDCESERLPEHAIPQREEIRQ